MPVSRSTSVYRRIAAELRQELHAGTYATGRQLPTEAVLATRFGVNHLTLRRALALLEAENLVVRRRGKGTFAGELAGRRSLLYVGDYESHFYKNLYVALATECQRLGFQLTAFDTAKGATAGDMRQALERLGAGMGGLICDVRHWAALQPLLPRPMAAPVFVGLRSAGSDAPGYHLYCDYFRAARLATEHLVSLGHRRIAYLGPWPADPADPLAPPDTTTEPFQGYRAAMDAARLPKLHPLSLTRDDDRLLATFQRLRHWPTAVVCELDFYAVRLLRTLTALGKRIPGDVSVIGLGNTPHCEATAPELTSISLGEREMARLALQCLQLPPPPQPVILHLGPTLVPRGSVRNLDAA